MEKKEIYKKILDILEKKINKNEYKIQPSVFVGGANMSTELQLSQLINNVGDSYDIKTVANTCFDRILKHME